MVDNAYIYRHTGRLGKKPFTTVSRPDLYFPWLWLILCSSPQTIYLYHYQSRIGRLLATYGLTTHTCAGYRDRNGGILCDVHAGCYSWLEQRLAPPKRKESLLGSWSQRPSSSQTLRYVGSSKERDEDVKFTVLPNPISLGRVHVKHTDSVTQPKVPRYPHWNSPQHSARHRPPPTLSPIFFLPYLLSSPSPSPMFSSIFYFSHRDLQFLIRYTQIAIEMGQAVRPITFACKLSDWNTRPICNRGLLIHEGVRLSWTFVAGGFLTNGGLHYLTFVHPSIWEDSDGCTSVHSMRQSTSRFLSLVRGPLHLGRRECMARLSGIGNDALRQLLISNTITTMDSIN